jgi:hypothetical protein
MVRRTAKELAAQLFRPRLRMTYPTPARPAQESPATLFTTEWIDGDETQEALDSSSI